MPMAFLDDEGAATIVYSHCPFEFCVSLYCAPVKDRRYRDVLGSFRDHPEIR